MGRYLPIDVLMVIPTADVVWMEPIKGVSSSWDNNEFALSPVCMDGIDNDGDGWIDETSAEMDRSFWQCSDFHWLAVVTIADDYCLTAYILMLNPAVCLICTHGRWLDGSLRSRR